jgi:ABC-type multidrug transport system ATPase subunit
VANSESIIIKNLIKTFNSYRAINNLSLQIRRNEMFIIVGPDGSGKTTLLRILAGILHFDSGDVQIFEHTLPRRAEEVSRAKSDGKLMKRCMLSRAWKDSKNGWPANYRAG